MSRLADELEALKPDCALGCRGEFDDGRCGLNSNGSLCCAVKKAIIALPAPDPEPNSDVMIGEFIARWDNAADGVCMDADTAQALAREFKRMRALRTADAAPQRRKDHWDADWWKPDPEDPFWMLEAEDGEWLKNRDSLLGTRDATKAIRFPTKEIAEAHPARMKAGSKWWFAKATEHTWCTADAELLTSTSVGDSKTADTAVNAEPGGDARDAELQKRKAVNTVLGELIGPLIPDLAERVRLGNLACTSILEKIAAIDATQPTDAELREVVGWLRGQANEDEHWDHADLAAKHRSIATLIERLAPAAVQSWPEVRFQALEEAARIGYRVCAETRHVTLGDKVAAAIRQHKDSEGWCGSFAGWACTGGILQRLCSSSGALAS